MTATAIVRAPSKEFPKVDLYDREHGTPAATASKLTTTKCAPPEIIMFPAVTQRDVRPQGSRAPMTFKVDREWATLFNRHLQKKIAAGVERPFFGFYHERKNGVSGHPLEIFWRDRHGVVALVEWTPIGEEMILNGTCTSFSPCWIHDDGSFPLGLAPYCGSLLHKTMKPALWFMEGRIRPVRAYDAMKLRASCYLRHLGDLHQEMRARGENDISAAADSVSRKFPSLRAAFDLDNALSSEFEQDVEAVY